jgi:hypothetical protein
MLRLKLLTLRKSPETVSVQFLFFKLEEEGMPALLLHLPKIVAETADLPSAFGFCCRLVVAFLQAAVFWYR